MRPERSFVSVVAGVVCLLAGTAAEAQVLAAPAQRPSQGLFGRGTRGDQTLDLTVSAVGGYDDNLLSTESIGLVNSPPEKSGLYEGLTGRLAYMKTFRDSAFGAAARSSLHYYPSLNEIVGQQHTATAGLLVQRQHGRISVTQTFGLFPLYSVAAIPGLFSPELTDLPPVLTEDVAVVRSEARNFATSASFTQLLSARLAFTASARIENTNYVEQKIHQREDRAAGHLVYHLTRDFGVVAGYEYQRGVYTLAGRSREAAHVHNFDVGIDFNRALSLSRRTTVGVSTGSVSLQGDHGRREHKLRGSARLNHEIGRTWQATAALYRGVSFIEGFRYPFLATTLSANIAGDLSRRMGLTFGGSYWTGQNESGGHHGGTGLAAGRNESYSATTRLRIAVSRSMALSTQYIFSHYRFASAPSLIVGFPDWTDRQSVRVGLDLQLPLVR